MLTAKVSSKGQVVLPKEVRKQMNIKAGDTVAFLPDKDGNAVLRRIDPLDAAFLRLACESFADWNHPEAERAFRDL
jgi:AbrB family looped-hinge helix DNA binding protein